MIDLDVNDHSVCGQFRVVGGEPPAEPGADRYREIFGDRCYLLAELLRGADDRAKLLQLQKLARDVGIPLVAAGDVHYHVPRRMVLHDVLTAIRHGTTVAAAEGTLLFPNAERHLRSLAEIREIFSDAPDALQRTIEIAERCHFSLDELKYQYPKELAPPGKTPFEYLTELTWQGSIERYPGGVPEKVREQIEVGAAAHRRAAIRSVFSHRVGFGAVRTLAKHFVPGPRVGGELSRVFLPGRNVGQSHDDRPAVRAIHQPRAERGARYRHRLRARAARGSAAVFV